jgi:HD-GYP domain-containing protein (c-di-GMP phosphodiesterase class II)
MIMLPAATTVRTLLVAVQQVRLYGGDHPAAREAIEQFFRVVQAGLEQGSVQIEIDERTVVVQAVPQPTEDRYVPQLHAHLAARRISGLTFQKDANADAVVTLVRLLAQEPEELLAEGGLGDAMRAAGASSIVVKEVTPVAGRPAVRAQDPYEAAVHAMHEIMTGTESGQPADLPQALLTVEGLAGALRTEPQHLWRCVADRGHDELDPAHAVNTCLLALFAADALGLPREVQIELGVGGLLHDIGLATQPWEQRLLERTAIGPRPEWRHPAEGAFLLRHIGGRESLPMIVAAEHHLPALGQGPVLPHSNLVALADYLDAMTCGRVPAARQMAIGSALEQLLRGLGPRFDPVQVRMLADLIRRQEAAGLEFSAPV